MKRTPADYRRDNTLRGLEMTLRIAGYQDMLISVMQDRQSAVAEIHNGRRVEMVNVTGLDPVQSITKILQQCFPA